MGKYKSDAETEIYNFLKILAVVVILIIGAYFFTNHVVNKSNKASNKEEEVEISENKIIVGSIFNRPYESYYVLAYKTEDNNNVIYETYLSMYESKDSSLKIFVVDLDNSLNKSYYSEKGNSKATKLDELKISSPTLIKISDKKITKYLEGQEQIKKELGL